MLRRVAVGRWVADPWNLSYVSPLSQAGFPAAGKPHWQKLNEDLERDESRFDDVPPSSPPAANKKPAKKKKPRRKSEADGKVQPEDGGGAPKGGKRKKKRLKPRPSLPTTGKDGGLE